MAVKLPLNEPRDRRQAADFDLIRELAALLEETGLSEIEIGEGPGRVRVARTVGGAYAVPAPTPQPTLASEPQGADLADVHKPVNVDSSHPGAVISPLVGVAYDAPEPGAEPFTKVGEQVSEGQTLFIVEAMKTMNPIRAPRGGRVAKILAENGAPVEYGEVLLVLE
ncbi:MAG: acetyl-CoA carboxylase biotin carboxyl carrier protein subunit [Alphaproteobacteria bacterium]|jgi:acetyl-CoA carboxylase biotin carboxyl carrier protein|nr:acetyl-CoA carboxylase biotin carboxyl carrier protein subunit [Alphaproteobacteria bacterium]MDP6816725.1 acetyl-CoA carboxylase biotin carboxyl carrier protein subunit [Alphaproteobacteria bacterium]